MGRIIGIDLGTTTSEIAYIKDGKPEVIINKEGLRITPSIVSIKKGEVLVGNIAKKNFIVSPLDSVKEVKRLMGTNEMVKMAGKEYAPEEVSAMILKNLKESAEAYLGETVTEAVITVPANFNDLERNATKKAGELAGLKVERIINEPTAAAMAYGIDNMECESKVLVYDLGGGTFDVTVLELFEGILDVKSSRGNNQLGGKDFDDKIVDFIVNNIKVEQGIDVRNDANAMSRIKETAEEIKKDLSTMDSTEVNLMYLTMDSDGRPVNVQFDITRKEFENMIIDLVNSTKDTIAEALEAAKYTVSDIDTVLLIGGSTRVPLVKNLVTNMFGDKVTSRINPDEAVALGAAVQAGIKNGDIKSEDGLVVTDVCSCTMGIEITRGTANNQYIDGVFDPIIYKDSKIPCIEKSTYSTLNDNQTSILIQVYQGDGSFVYENTKIGEFNLSGIPQAPAGEEEVEVQFKYNLNGILEVSATVLSNGKSIQGTIDTSKLYEMNKTSSNSLNVDSWSEYPLADSIRDTINLAERRKSKVNPKFISKIDKMIEELKMAVINNDSNLVSRLDSELTDLLFDL